jgi:hypothetical protein
LETIATGSGLNRPAILKEAEEGIGVEILGK